MNVGKMSESFKDAESAALFGDIAACFAHGILDAGHSVGRGGDHAGVGAVEHGEIVVVVACRKDVIFFHAVDAGDFREGGSLGKAGMGEVEIAGIADENHVGQMGDSRLEIALDGIRFLSGAGGKEGEEIPMEHGFEGKAFTDLVADGMKFRAVAFEDLVMGVLGSGIPFCKLAVARVFPGMNVAFLRDNEVGGKIRCKALE